MLTWRRSLILAVAHVFRLPRPIIIFYLYWFLFIAHTRRIPCRTHKIHLATFYNATLGNSRTPRTLLPNLTTTELISKHVKLL